MKHLELYNDHEAGIIYFNTELHVVHTIWKDIFVQGEVLRIVLNDVITLLKARHTNAVLTDARKMRVIGDEDQEWIVKDWYPRAFAEGFFIEAMLVTKGSFNDHTLQQIVKQYDRKEVAIRFFTNYHDAAEWLRVYTGWKERS